MLTIEGLWYIKHKEGHLLVTGAPIGLPIDGQPGICITKIVAQFSRRGGYFCVLWTKNRCTAQCAGLYFHEMEVMPMNEKRKNEKKTFDFKDLMAFGMFILA